MSNTKEDLLPTPGSLVLIDVNANTARPDESVVLSPTPSNDANDPLRWSHTRKQVAHACLVMYTMTVGIACTIVYSILVPIAADTGVPVATLNAGTGYILGWGGLLTQPLALTFGKRGVYLLSQVGSIGVLIWMVFIKSNSSWLANKVLQGLFSSPIEMLIEESIGDIFYAHERGFYIGIYAFTLFGSNYVAPIIGGFIYQSLGYKWVFYIAAIIQAVGLVLSFFFMEETNFRRGTTELAEKHDVQAGYPSSTESPMVEGESKADLKSEQAEVGVVPHLANLTGELQGRPYTFFERLRFFDRRYATSSAALAMMYRPIVLLRFPVVFWAGFQYGACLVWYNVLNATASPIFSAAPYNFKPSSVGLTYFGPLIGVFVAALYSGYFGDKFSLWTAQRKRGVREPEDRLWLMSILVILVPLSLILWGVGASKGIHWIGLVIGGGISACASAIGATLTINYVLDSYKDLSGETLISIILVRNTLSFAIGYGITPWLGLGLQNTFISAAFIGMAISCTFLIFIKWGKRLRHSSRAAYWKYVETSVLPPM